MTEYEKIVYAKSFIDRLANGINPLDDTPIPEGDIVNNVRLSRCFFYISSVLQGVIDGEHRKTSKKKKSAIPPFSISQEELRGFEYSRTPISATAIAKKINFLVSEKIQAKEMQRLSYKNINHWLRMLGLIEWREWEDGKQKRFPTPEGEAMGLVLGTWVDHGKNLPVIYFSEEAQRFIIDNIEAVIAAGAESPSDQPHNEVKDE